MPRDALAAPERIARGLSRGLKGELGSLGKALWNMPGALRQKPKCLFSGRLDYSQKNSTTSVAEARVWPKAIQP
jgi:hypothetical protein